MNADARALTHALFGVDAAAREAAMAAAGPGPSGARTGADDERGGAVWLECPCCGGTEFTVHVPVTLDVARPFAHAGRAFAADDYEAHVSVNGLDGGTAADAVWTCTACGTAASGTQLAHRDAFDPLHELFDAEPGVDAALVCGRCGGADLELWRHSVERVPVVLLPSADATPAVVEGPRPLGADVIATVTWCRTCGLPVDRLETPSS